MPNQPDLPSFMESMATPLLAGTALVLLLRRMGIPVPVVPLAKALVALIFLIAVASLVGAFGRERPVVAGCALLLASLASFLVRYRQATEDARSADAEKLRRARGQERRRAQGNVPATGAPAGQVAGATRPTSGTAP